MEEIYARDRDCSGPVAHCTAYHVIANTYRSFVFSSIDTGVTPVVILVNNVLVVGSNAQADIYHVVMH